MCPVGARTVEGCLKVLAVGFGGFLGAVSRYLLSGLAQSVFKSTTYPVGTLTINIIGCLTIGVLSELAESRGILAGTSGAFLFIGVLGGFTTFSAFSNETAVLLRDGESVHAAVSVVSHVVLCLVAVWVGRMAAHAVWSQA